ncbi:MAG: hypothetical protein KDA86_26545, partial [Planctomycetaceae bacterium]|nr:hypothetical protein [Planctomycetaceae bacterium]
MVRCRSTPPLLHQVGKKLLDIARRDVYELTAVYCSVSHRWGLIEGCTGSGDFGEDVFGFLGPH